MKRRPQRVRALALVDTRASADDTAAKAKRDAPRDRRLLQGIALDPARGLPDAWTASAAAPSVLHVRGDRADPLPKGVACTEVYGGPQKAEVRGRFRNHRVLALFTRTNGCEIARWDKVQFLFPGT